jgi:hypothetical protein
MALVPIPMATIDASQHDTFDGACTASRECLREENLFKCEWCTSTSRLFDKFAYAKIKEGSPSPFEAPDDFDLALTMKEMSLPALDAKQDKGFRTFVQNLTLGWIPLDA